MRRANAAVTLGLFLIAACSGVRSQPTTQPAADDGTAGGRSVTSQPTTRPVADSPCPPATTQPASAAVAAAASSGNAEVDTLLDRLEQKGAAITGLSSRITYRFVTVEPVEDVQTKIGTLLFARAEPNPRFLIHFNRLIAGGIESERGEYFLFDGQWLTERNDKARTVTRREIVRRGERVDPFRIGKGPFPLPFGQKREEILQNFSVSLKDFEPGDPRNTRHLHCVPRPNTELASKYRRVELYIDRDVELPVRIVTERLSDGNRIEVDFADIDTKEAPALSRFQVATPPEFTYTEEPLPVLETPTPPSAKP